MCDTRSRTWYQDLVPVSGMYVMSITLSVNVSHYVGVKVPSVS